MSIVEKIKIAFGEPRKGNHKNRTFFDLAANDVYATVLAAVIIAVIFNTSFPHMLLTLFLIAILLHYAFGVDTTINKFIYR